MIAFVHVGKIGRKGELDQTLRTAHICLWSWEWRSREQLWIIDPVGAHEWLVVGSAFAMAAWTDSSCVTSSSVLSMVHIYICKNARVHKWEYQPSPFRWNVQLDQGCWRGTSVRQNSPVLHAGSGLNEFWGVGVGKGHVNLCQGARNLRKLTGCMERNARAFRSPCFRFWNSLLGTVIYLALSSEHRASFQGL